MSKIPAEHDETDAINALINSKLILSSQLSSINFSFISVSGSNRFRITPVYTEAFLNTHAEHIHYIEFYPTQIIVFNAVWNSSTRKWGYTSKYVNLT